MTRIFRPCATALIAAVAAIHAASVAAQSHAAPQTDAAQSLSAIAGDSLLNASSGAFYTDPLVAWEDLARKVNPKAQYNLGLVYTTGQAVQKDERIAAQWFRKAAEQGLIDAQYRLGLLYHTGHGVEPNMQEAAHWYRKAAEQGSRQAQFDLGTLHENGQGV